MRVIEDHTIDVTNSRENSHSLLAVCGSASLAKEIQYSKISHDVITAMTGHCQSHTMDYISESYGGTRAKAKDENSINKESVTLNIYDNEVDCVEVQLLTNRKTISFLDNDCYDSFSVADLEKNHKSYLFEF